MSKDKKSKGKNRDGAPKKRGNPGDIHGEREKFLLDLVDEYCRHSDERSTRDWWKTVWDTYWLKFPWDLPLSVEPPANLEGYGKPDSELSVEEKAAKVKIMDETEAVGGIRDDGGDR